MDIFWRLRGLIGKRDAPPPKVEIQLDHVGPIWILLCDRWWVSDVCCHFHQTGGKVSQFNWFLFIDLLYGKERKPRWNILDWICFLCFFDGAWHEISENFGPPDLWKTLVHFFRWLKSNDGWSCKIQVCICACWTWLAATSRGDQRNWWYCGTVKRGILYWTCDNPSGHPNIWWYDIYIFIWYIMYK